MSYLAGTRLQNAEPRPAGKWKRAELQLPEEAEQPPRVGQEDAGGPVKAFSQK